MPDCWRYRPLGCGSRTRTNAASRCIGLVSRARSAAIGIPPANLTVDVSAGQSHRSSESSVPTES